MFLIKMASFITIWKRRSRLRWVLVIGAIIKLIMLGVVLMQTGMLSFERGIYFYLQSVEELTSPRETHPAIVFLKTHKTGGSSIQNLCLRYAVTHDLLIALPRWYNYFGHPKPFDKSMVALPLNDLKYQVFAHHTRFNYKNLKDLMPEDAVFFTIVREPASLFESSYGYYNMEYVLGMSLEEFVSHNKSYIDLLNQRVKGNGRYGRNQMTFDFGGEIEHFENEEEIQKLADTLNDQFQLVMIMERMNESLVLLKHLLSWTTDDVVVMHLNSRQDKVKKKLTPEVKAKILFWNKADLFIYEYFFKKFDDKVKAFGKDKMNEEVQELSARMDQWYSYCVAKVNRDTSWISANIEGFEMADVHNKTCEYLVKDELDFTSELVRRQAKLVSWRRKF